MSEGAVACPACDQPTLTAAGTGEVCEVCGWRDEGVLRGDAATENASGVSLAEARANVAAFGVAYPPSEVGGS